MLRGRRKAGDCRSITVSYKHLELGVGRSSMVWHSMMERLATSLSCYAMPRYTSVRTVVVMRGGVVVVSDTRRLVEEKAPPRLNNKKIRTIRKTTKTKNKKQKPKKEKKKKKKKPPKKKNQKKRKPPIGSVWEGWSVEIGLGICQERETNLPE